MGLNNMSHGVCSASEEDRTRGPRPGLWMGLLDVGWRPEHNTNRKFTKTCECIKITMKNGCFPTLGC